MNSAFHFNAHSFSFFKYPRVFNMFFNVLVQYIPSARGGTLLLYKKYTYFVKYRTIRGGFISWKCSTKTDCKRTIKVSNDVVIAENDEHDHPPPNFMIISGKYIRV